MFAALRVDLLSTAILTLTLCMPCDLGPPSLLLFPLPLPLLLLHVCVEPVRRVGQGTVGDHVTGRGEQPRGEGDVAAT